MIRDDKWFTEEAEEIGTAFSLRIHDKLHEERSDFQTIAVYDTTHYGRLMTIDGYIMLSSRDNFVYHEMMTHPAILAHGAVRDVAIIGGGDCGSLREVLKHPGVTAATQIDIDERVTRVAEQYFPELCERNDDPRATLAFADGIAWMRERAPESLDLIVVDSTDPIGPAEGLFNEAFYRDCRRALRPGGILVQQSESPLAHTQLICAMHAAMTAAGFARTHVLSFPLPVYPTGWWSATLARVDDTPLIEPEDEDIGDLATDYYTAAIHRGALAQPAFLRRELAEKLPAD
ncbi:spermidine synthase [Salinisphaera sp. PC39]|uniref:polyamine aminopropyltransferase n=1 Tax=Salinisphaera sp. PC39 TaxID=1304156 RepID=UPI003342198A